MSVILKLAQLMFSALAYIKKFFIYEAQDEHISNPLTDPTR